MTRQEKLNVMAGILPDDVMEAVTALCKLQDADDCISEIFAWDGETVERELIEDHFTGITGLLMFKLKDSLTKYLNDNE